MNKFMIILLLSVFCPDTTNALTAESDSHPGRLTKTRGVTYYNYNITQSIDETDGKSRTVYKYDYVVIKGSVTRSKIKAALDQAKEEAEVLTGDDLDSIDAAFKNR